MDRPTHPTTNQNLAHQIRRGSLTLARVSPTTPTKKKKRFLYTLTDIITGTSFLWGIAALPLGIYVIAQDLNVPLIVQPQLFGLLSLLSWGQCMYYGEPQRRSRTWCALVLGGTLTIWGALEAAVVLALRVRERLSFFSHADGNRCVMLNLFSLRIEVACPPAKLACASSGSWVLF